MYNSQIINDDTVDACSSSTSHSKNVSIHLSSASTSGTPLSPMNSNAFRTNLPMPSNKLDFMFQRLHEHHPEVLKDILNEYTTYNGKREENTLHTSSVLPPSAVSDSPLCITPFNSINSNIREKQKDSVDVNKSHSKIKNVITNLHGSYNKWKEKRSNGFTGRYRVKKRSIMKYQPSFYIRGKEKTRIRLKSFKLEVDAARVADMAAKLLKYPGYNFENEDEYLHEREIELQNLLREHKFPESMRPCFDITLPTAKELLDMMKISVDELVKVALPSDESLSPRNSVPEIIIQTTTPEKYLDGNTINVDCNMNVAYRAFDFKTCMNMFDEGKRVSMVNVDDTNVAKDLASEYVLIVGVGQSANIRRHPEWCEFIDIMYHSNHKYKDRVMQESAICNRDSKQVLISYSQYKRCPSEFVEMGLFLVQKELAADLRICEKNKAQDRSFLTKFNVLRICGFDMENIYVDEMKIQTNLDHIDSLKWFLLPNINTCLVVFAVSAEKGYCPWHPVSDKTTAKKQTTEIDLHCNLCYSLGGYQRYFGLVNSKSCYFVDCQFKACSAGLCTRNMPWRVCVSARVSV